MVYNLENETNEIKMIRNDYLTSCIAMFSDLENIIYIDLSKFDSLKVTDMSCMFTNCKSLVLININDLKIFDI